MLKDPRNECKLPKEALAVVRYHSFYPWHREGAYGYLMGEGDEEMLGWVREFNSFDLYNKTEERVDVGTLKVSGFGTVGGVDWYMLTGSGDSGIIWILLKSFSQGRRSFGRFRRRCMPCHTYGSKTDANFSGGCWVLCSRVAAFLLLSI